MLSKTLTNYIDNLPERVSKKSVLARNLAREYEIFKNIDNTLLSDSASLYCLGNQFISERILEKPGKLTNTEFMVIKLIPYLSYKIVEDEDIDEDVKFMCLYYHEENPLVIENTSIPPITEMIQKRRCELYTIDSYIAMTSRRSYREAFSVKKAIEILQDNPNTSKDVLAFIKQNYYF